MLRLRRPQLGLPPHLLPLFWALVLIEAAYGAYLGILPLWIEKLGAPIAIVGLLLGANGILRLFILYPSTTIANRLGTAYPPDHVTHRLHDGSGGLPCQ